VIDRDYTERILADIEREDPHGTASVLLRPMLQRVLDQDGPILMTTGDRVVELFRDRRTEVPAVRSAEGDYRVQRADGSERQLLVDGARLVLYSPDAPGPIGYRELLGDELAVHLDKIKDRRFGPGPDASAGARFDWILNTEPSKVTEKLEREPDLIHVATDSGERLIHLAARSDNVWLIARLIELGTDVNAVNNDGESPLLEHVLFGTDPEIVRMLVEAGADVNLASNDGETPLWVAAASGHGVDVRRLLDAGADPSIGFAGLIIATL
jgi:hypothetical protein